MKEPLFSQLIVWAVLACVFLPTKSMAQGEANWWFFGDSISMNFSAGPPSLFANSPMHSINGCASISDPNGNLQFYSDGKQVWNANHMLMPNGSGLFGSDSASQHMIVHHPATPNIYFLFHHTSSLQTSGEDLYYSEVDMTLNGGLGDVNLNKNIYVDSDLSTKITAIWHANQTDIWIIAYAEPLVFTGPPQFKAYLLTATGLSAPVVTSPGPSISFSERGQLKASPDGKKLGLANGQASQFQLYDFDNTSGVVSNFQSYPLPSGVGFSGSHGFEFSPNSKLCYITIGNGVYQHDMTTGNTVLIHPTGTLFESFYDLQLAPDGKIYATGFEMTIWSFPVSTVFAARLGSIDFPNLPGTGSGFSVHYTFIDNTAWVGLPSFNQVNLPCIQALMEDTICMGDTLIAEIDCQLADSVFWDFGDPASGAGNYSSLDSAGHVFSGPGKYVITSYIFHSVTTDTLVDSVYVESIPQACLIPDSTYCQGDTLQLAQTDANWAYLWQDNTTDTFSIITGPGTYWVEIQNQCGSDTDSVVVSTVLIGTINLPGDTVICSGDTLILDASIDQGTYLWQDSSTNAQLTVTNPGIYWVEANNVCGASVSDTVEVEVAVPITIDLGPDSVLCNGDTLPLLVSGSQASYLWSTGSTDSSINITTTGLYWVSANNACGTVADTIQVDVVTLPAFSLGGNVEGCTGQTVDLILPWLPHASYNWSHPTASDTLLQTFTDGIFWASITNACGTASDTVSVQFVDQPELLLPGDTAICVGDQVSIGPVQTNLMAWVWEDGSADSIKLVQGSQTLTIHGSNACGTVSDSITIVEIALPTVELLPPTEICPGEQLPIRTRGIDLSYQWSDGSTRPTLFIHKAGTYSVEFTDPYGCSNVAAVTVPWCPSIFIPSAFTPNADGINDQFRIEGEYLEQFELQIFDRWGELIFQTSDQQQGWDGHFKDAPALVGVYVYQVSFLGRQQRQKTLRGHFSLVR